MTLHESVIAAMKGIKITRVKATVKRAEAFIMDADVTAQ